MALTLTLAVSGSAESVELGFVVGMGGSGEDVGGSIAVDGSGNVYTTGHFSGTVDFDPGAGTFNLIGAGREKIFVQKLDVDGNLVWAKGTYGTGGGTGYGIAVDEAGNVYTSGGFSGTLDFDPSPGEVIFTSAREGWGDIFVQKLDAAGTLVWVKTMGGVDADWASAIAVDGTGNVYVSGGFEDTTDFDPDAGTVTLTSAGIFDIFVLKLDAAGNLLWARAMGGASYDNAWGIAVDASGSVYTTGHFSETVDFDPGAGVVSLASTGEESVFVQKLNTDGKFVWAKAMGGSETEDVSGIAVDGAGNVYTTGYFQGTADFDPSAGTTNLATAGFEGIFVQKLDVDGNFLWARGMDGAGSGTGGGIAVNISGGVFITGRFAGTIDFDPGTETANLRSVGGYNIFVERLDTDGNFVWARAVGGTDYASGSGIAVNGSANVHITGHFKGTADFETGLASANFSSAGDYDIFVQKLVPSVDSPGEGEGEGEGEMPTGGCPASCGDFLAGVRNTLGDFLLFGVALITLFAYSGLAKRS